MKYSIRINEVKSEDSQIKAFATVTFDESLLVRNIAIVERRDTGDLFVSMPSYRTNDVTEKGEPIYRDVCNPITKDFYEEFSRNILTAYDNRGNIGKNGMEFSKDGSKPMKFAVKVSPMERENSSLKGLGRIYLNDDFVISNVKLVDGKNGMFISMPDYRTEKYKDGKPVYRELVFPVTKEFREKLYGEFDKAYAAEKNKDKSADEPDKEADRVAEKKQAKKSKAKTEDEPELAVAR